MSNSNPPVMSASFAGPVQDRSTILTEQRNPRTKDLHRLSVTECVRRIQEEDRAVHVALEYGRAQLVDFISAVEPRFRQGGRLIYLGAGTSGRLGVLDASEAPPTFHVGRDRIIGIIAGGDRALRQSSEGAEDDPEGAWAELSSLNLKASDAVLGIAAGGTTPYVLGGIIGAKMFCPNLVTGLLSCAPVKKPGLCDHLMVLPTGPEVLTGSTRMKAGSATKMALNTISTTLMIRSGRVYGNLMVDVRPTNAKLADRAARIIAELCGIERSEGLLWLERAQGAVKIAVLMQRYNLDFSTAQSLLALRDNNLGALLDAELNGLSQAC